MGCGSCHSIFSLSVPRNDWSFGFLNDVRRSPRFVLWRQLSTRQRSPHWKFRQWRDGNFATPTVTGWVTPLMLKNGRRKFRSLVPKEGHRLQKGTPWTGKGSLQFSSFVSTAVLCPEAPILERWHRTHLGPQDGSTATETGRPINQVSPASTPDRPQLWRARARSCAPYRSQYFLFPTIGIKSILRRTFCFLILVRILSVIAIRYAHPFKLFKS